MKLLIDAVSDVGCIRTNNEDMILVGNQLIRDKAVEYLLEAEEKNFFIAVADGMGGHNSGEIASEFVMQHMAAIVTTFPASLDSLQLKNEVVAHVNRIHEALNQLGITTTHAGLGTTFMGLLFYEGKAFSINIGDSRLYRLRGGVLAQITRDHSLTRMLNDDRISAYTIVNAFGGGVSNIFIDFEDVSLFIDDLILLCSDGLTEELTDDEIESALNNNDNSRILIDYAKSKGGKDNISCIKITILKNNG